MSFYDLVALAEAGHTVYEILDFVGMPMFGYPDKGLPWPKPGQFKGSARNPKTVSEYKPMPKKSEMKKTLPIGEATPTKKRPPVDYPTPDRTPKKPRVKAPERKLPVVTRPSKKTKITPTMPKAKNEKINGEHGNVVTNTSSIIVGKSKVTLGKKMEKKGDYIHCHNYAEKVTTDLSGFRAWDSLKPTIAFENFQTYPVGSGDPLGVDLTALNVNLSGLDNNFYTRLPTIEADGGAGPAITDYRAGNSYFLLKNIMHTLHLKNMFNLPVRITCYWVTPKQNCRATPVNDFSNLQTQMNITPLTPNLNTSVATLGTDFGFDRGFTPVTINGRQKSFLGTYRGVLPTDIKEWRQRWKVLKKDTINLPSGGLVVHSVNFKYNKLFSASYATQQVAEWRLPIGPLQPPEVDGPLLIKGLSVIPMLCFEGYLSQADRSEALDQPTFGNVDVNVGVETKSRVSWVTNNTVNPKQSINYTTLLYATKTAEEFINAVDADANGDPAN